MKYIEERKIFLAHKKNLKNLKNNFKIILNVNLGYSIEELAMYRPAVFGNAIQGLIIILRAMVKLNINWTEQQLEMSVTNLV